MRRPALALALLAALALPAQAAAQVPPAPAPAPPAPAPPPVPTAALSITAQDVLGGKSPAALAGRTFTARVVMKPFVANEGAILRVYRGSKKLNVKSLTFKPVAGGTSGVATFKVSSKTSGKLTLKASHKATPGLATAVAKPVRVAVVRAYAGPGSRGPAVKLLQDKLAALHYVVPRSGVYDAGTGRAIMAWRKVAGYSRTYIATADVFAGLLKGRGVFKVRHPGDGRHVEARINAQVLALIDQGKVQRIYHTSSGAPATPTVRGKFRVYSKTPGTNAKGMVDSNYFIRGYAIHGYASVPPYNASHGCLRVPVANARAIYDWLRIGDVVWVEP
jgi:peptidoglycan hydrolase-like protein with peptidoglycan-binding domain